MDQKGYLMLESLIAFLLLVGCIIVYLPLTVGLLQHLDHERKSVEMSRVAYEQAQKMVISQTNDHTWESGGETYFIEITETLQGKGVKVAYENKEEISVQIFSFTVVTP